MLPPGATGPISAARPEVADNPGMHGIVARCFAVDGSDGSITCMSVAGTGGGRGRVGGVVAWVIATGLHCAVGPCAVADASSGGGSPAVPGASAAPVEQARARLAVAPGLRVEAWAAEPLLKDVTSIDFDGSGRAYVVETGRRRTSVFDIRNFKDWVEDDLALRTVEDRARFLTGQLATNAAFLAAATRGGRGGFRDFNGDGVVDGRDLQVESERLRLVWDSDGDGRADRSEVLVDGLDGITSGVAAGVMVAGGDVWMTCIPDVWKWPAPGPMPGKIEKGKPLLSGFGVHVAYGGHDLHGLAMGPDGRVYFTVADRGASVHTREDVTWAEPDVGAVFRCEPDGSGLEVYARGLRNPQELAFDDLGNLWTGDNNGDGGDKARWTLVLPGSDHGWTIGWQWLPGMGAWNSERMWHLRGTNTALHVVPPVAHVGHGPAGIAFYPGTGLGDRYAGSFFVADFPGGIRHLRVEPDGAFFRVKAAGAWLEDNRAESMEGKLLWGLSPVDVAFPPGGGVVVADWVEGWEKTGKGRLWRVHDPGLAGDEKVAGTARLLAREFEGEAEAIVAMAHQDLRVRQKAQFHLASRGGDAWEALEEAAFRGVNSFQRRHALRALAQVARADTRRHGWTEELSGLMRLMDDPDPAVAVEACRLMGESRFVTADVRLRKAFGHPNPQVAAAAILAHGQLFRVMAGIHPAGGAATWGQPARYHLGAMERLVRSLPTFARRWLGTAGMGSRPSLTWPLPELAEVLARADGKDPVVRHAAVQHVVALWHASGGMLFPGITPLARHPSPAVRGVVLLAYRRLALPEAAGFLEDGDPWLALEAARAVHDAGIAAGYKDLIQKLDTGLPKGASAAMASASARLPFSELEWRTFYLRRSVNAAFRRGTAEDLAILARAAMNTELPEQVRVEAVEALRDWPSPPRRDRVTGLTAGWAARDMAGARGALSDAWAACTGTNAPSALVVAALEAGRTLALPGMAARTEMLARHPAEAVRKAVASHAMEHGMASDRQVVGAGPGNVAEWLAGGDAARGRRLFAEKSDWGCMRCHKLGGVGGDVGPELGGIGKRLGREQVMESILYPNRRIAAGYETVVLTLDDGETVSGVVRREGGGEVVLGMADGGETRVPSGKIRARDRAMSAMPEGLGDLMTRGELRDLVEALSE